MVALACVARNVENRREPRNIHSTSFGHSRLWKSVERAEFVERTVMFSGRNSGKRNCLYTTIRAGNARRHSNLSTPPPLLRKKKKEAALFAKSSFLFTPSVAPCRLRSFQVAPSLTTKLPSDPEEAARAREFVSLQSPNISLGTLPRTHPFDTIPGSREGRQLPCKAQSPRHNTTPPEMCVRNVPSTTNDHLEASRDARTFFINVMRRHPESDIVFWTRLLLKSTSPSGEHLLRCLARTRRRTRDFARRTRCVIIGTHCSMC